MDLPYKKITIEKEAARRRLLRIVERCLPEWTKTLDSQQLVEITMSLLQAMPPEICRLERDKGKVAAGYPPEAFVVANLKRGCP